MISLRIDREGFRFRIIPDDLSILLRGESVIQRIAAIECAIVLAEEKDMRLEVHDKRFILYVSRSALERLRDLGRSKSGISVLQDGAEIALQVDLKEQRPA